MAITITKKQYARGVKKLSKTQVKQVSKIVNKSKKYKMTCGCFTGYINLATSWTELYDQPGSAGLDAIAEGNESYERQGDTIMVKRHKIHLDFSNENITLAYHNPVRVVIARLFGTYTNTPADYFDQNNVKGNFEVEKGTVLYDETFMMGIGPNYKNMNVVLKCKTSKIPHILVQYGTESESPYTVQKNDVRVFVALLTTPATNSDVRCFLSDSIGYYDKY